MAIVPRRTSPTLRDGHRARGARRSDFAMAIRQPERSAIS